ncbi:hypothetical protein PIB30_038205 [Stylosanthes scabra]|uniref:PB1-like domain-containing protein n=1 Tax=Stylosanthes scabra TaxID=79078 RepID=A0ABU6REL8_9FABA|nr:hypothetical protein [Stylosanthes scabra]
MYPRPSGNTTVPLMIKKSRHPCPCVTVPHMSVMLSDELASNGVDVSLKRLNSEVVNIVIASKGRRRRGVRMGDRFVVPVYHHGGNFVRHPNGELVYANGEEKRFEMYELDIDHLNMRDMVTLLEDIGYKSHKALHWFDVTAPEFETGLNELDGDQGICELIDWLRTNKEPEFHIYVEHSISKPILAEDVGDGNCETINLEDDGDNAAEGDALKEPSPGSDVEVNAKQSNKKRKVSSPKKMSHQLT